MICFCGYGTVSFDDVMKIGDTQINGWKTCSSATVSATSLTWMDLGSNTDLHSKRPTTSHLSHGTAPTACQRFYFRHWVNWSHTINVCAFNYIWFITASLTCIHTVQSNYTTSKIALTHQNCTSSPPSPSHCSELLLGPTCKNITDRLNQITPIIYSVSVGTFLFQP